MGFGMKWSVIYTGDHRVNVRLPSQLLAKSLTTFVAIFGRVTSCTVTQSNLSILPRGSSHSRRLHSLGSPRVGGRGWYSRPRSIRAAVGVRIQIRLEGGSVRDLNIIGI